MGEELLREKHMAVINIMRGLLKIVEGLVESRGQFNKETTSVVFYNCRVRM